MLAQHRLIRPSFPVSPKRRPHRPQADEVWAVLLDFERYGEWNPFHSRVDVVEHGDGVAVRMRVAMGLLGELVSTEQASHAPAIAR